MHLAARRDQRGEFLGEHRLAGPVDAVERDDHPLALAHGQQGVSELAEHPAPVTGRWGWDERVEASRRHPARWLVEDAVGGWRAPVS